MSQQKQKKMRKTTLRLNDGTSKTFEYELPQSIEGRLAEYVAEMMLATNHPEKYTSKELLEAPWAVTQSDLLLKTYYHSLDELAEKAWRFY